MISTGGDIAIITATAYDVKDNRVKDDVISFQLKSGPGAGEHLNPPTAITDESGRAVTNLVSGTSPSEQQDVWVIASTFTGIKSNTFKFTIAGPPAYVTFRKDIARITQNSDGTYSKKCVALVTDVNRNPVADGTPVTFSLQITGFIVYKKIGYYMPGLKSYNISDTGYVLPFEDFNDNYERDFYENDRSGYPLYRGEDIVYAANDKDYNPGSPFYDINCNGRRDYDPSFINYERPEPCTTVTMQRIITLYDTITVDSIVQRDSSFSVDSTVFADFNYNNKLDTYEPLVDNQMTDAEYEAGAGFIPGFGYPDIDWNNNNVPDPATTVIITKNIETDNGKAPNMITFGQTDALRIRVKVWVESEGVSSASPEEFTLPIMEDDVKYFNPFYGKKYY